MDGHEKPQTSIGWNAECFFPDGHPLPKAVLTFDVGIRPLARFDEAGSQNFTIFAPSVNFIPQIVRLPAGMVLAPHSTQKRLNHLRVHP